MTELSDATGFVAEVDRRKATIDLVRRFGSWPKLFPAPRLSVPPQSIFFGQELDELNSEHGETNDAVLDAKSEIAITSPDRAYSTRETGTVSLTSRSKSSVAVSNDNIITRNAVFPGSDGYKSGTFHMVPSTAQLFTSDNGGKTHSDQEEILHHPAEKRRTRVKKRRSSCFVIPQPHSHDALHNYQAAHHPRKRSFRTSEMSRHMSALYGILLTITSCCLSVSSTLTYNMDDNYSRWFDSGMMAVGCIWLIFAFVYLFRLPAKPRKPSHSTAVNVYHDIQNVFSDSDRFVENDVDSGSFYLKMGATLFGIGSMIYACLQLGVFVENVSCFSIAVGLNPCLFTLFVILQLYFIFKNSQFKITKYRAISRFGLIHLVATDLCIWVRTLLNETLEEFTLLRKSQDDIATVQMADLLLKEGQNSANVTFLIQELAGSHQQSLLRNNNPLCINEGSVMEEVMEQASMFLFPCIIEYSLISAGIIYIMWAVVGRREPHQTSLEAKITGKHPRLFAVDCNHATNGLFGGIFLVVLTLVGLILYFLYSNDPDPEVSKMAVVIYTSMDISLNTIGVITVVCCAVQFLRKLKRVNINTANMELDDGLLMLTMMGVYAYSVVSILGTFHVKTDSFSLLFIAASVMELAQATAQSVFIFDASKRCVDYPDELSATDLRKPQLEKPKPAREMVTLLLAINFAQWAIDILCTLRADASPIPRDFFGGNTWAILLHMTVPLVIFYRFHSTVCLFDIWKHAYKVHGHRSSMHIPTTEPEALDSSLSHSDMF